MPRKRDPVPWGPETSFEDAFRNPVRGREIFLCSLEDGEGRETIKAHQRGVLRILNRDGNLAFRINDEKPLPLPVWATAEGCVPFYNSVLLRRGSRKFYKIEDLDTEFYKFHGDVGECIPTPRGTVLVTDIEQTNIVEIGSFMLGWHQRRVHSEPFDEVKLHINLAVVRKGNDFFVGGEKKPFWTSPEPWVDETPWWVCTIDKKPAIAKYDAETKTIVMAKRPSILLFHGDINDHKNVDVCAAYGHLAVRDGHSLLCDGNNLSNHYLCDSSHEHFFGFLLNFNGDLRLVIIK